MCMSLAQIATKIAKNFIEAKGIMIIMERERAYEVEREPKKKTTTNDKEM